MSTPLDSDRTNESGVTDFELALSSLKPVSRISRDQIFHQVGQQHAQTHLTTQPHWSARSYWPAIAASLALVVIGQGGLLARRPSCEIKVVYVGVPQPPTTESPVSESSSQVAASPAMVFDHPGPTAIDRLSWQLMHNGLDALPTTPMMAFDPAEHPLSPGQTLEIHMHKFNSPGDAL